MATPAAPGTVVSKIVKRNLERNDFMMHLKVEFAGQRAGQRKRAIDLPSGSEKFSLTFYQIEDG